MAGELLEVLRAYRAQPVTFYAPLSLAERIALASHLECALPDEIEALYADHDGDTPLTPLLFHMMSATEAMKWFDTTRAYDEHEDPPLRWAEYGARAFWSDDNSNYAAIYVTGPMRGCVCFLAFDGTFDMRPMYRSVANFLWALLAAAPEGLDWTEMPTDYPELTPRHDYAQSAADWARAQAMLALFEAMPSTDDFLDSGQRAYYASCAMNLTPFERSATLYRFLTDRDITIQARACEILGVRRWKDATPLLEIAAKQGVEMVRFRATRALTMISSIDR